MAGYRGEAIRREERSQDKMRGKGMTGETIVRRKWQMDYNRVQRSTGDVTR